MKNKVDLIIPGGKERGTSLRRGSGLLILKVFMAVRGGVRHTVGMPTRGFTITFKSTHKKSHICV